MMKRFFLSLLLCVSAGMAVSAATMAAVQDGKEDDGTTSNSQGKMVRDSLRVIDANSWVRLDLVLDGDKYDPTGIGGSVGEGPRVPTSVWPWTPSYAPEVPPPINNASGGNSAADAVAGGIVNNSAETAYGSIDATGMGITVQSPSGANQDDVSKKPSVVNNDDFPNLPLGVGGHVVSDGGGPKPTLPTKPSKPSGNRKYSDGTVIVEVGGGDQDGNLRGSGDVTKPHHFDIEPGIPVLPDGVGGSVVSDNPKPSKPGATRPSKYTGKTLSEFSAGSNIGGSGSGSQGSDALVPYIPEGNYAPSVNGVNITNLIPFGSKKDLGSAAALIDIILEAYPDLDFSEVSALVDELMAH